MAQKWSREDDWQDVLNSPLKGTKLRNTVPMELPYRKEWRGDALGHVLVAQRDLELGDLLMRDTGIVVAPLRALEGECCAGCAGSLDVSAIKCQQSGCDAWTCGADACWRAHRLECAPLRSLTCGDDGLDPAEAAFLLRACGARDSMTGQLHTAQDLWDELAKVPFDLHRYESSERFRRDKQVIGRALPILQRYANMTEENTHVAFSLEDFLRLLYFFRINAHGCSFPMQDEQTATGFFPSLRLLQHSCSPNCAVVFVEVLEGIVDVALTTAMSQKIAADDKSPRRLAAEVRIVERVAKGEPLSIAYCELLQPTWRRQQELSMNWYFECKCDRCLQGDAEAFGTWACAKCRAMTLSCGAASVCTRCGASESREAVRMRASALEEKLETAEAKAVDGGSTQPLDAWLRKHALADGHYLRCRCHYIAAGLLAARLSKILRSSCGAARGDGAELAEELLMHVDGAMRGFGAVLPTYHLQRAELLHFQGLALLASSSCDGQLPTTHKHKGVELLRQARSQYLVLGRHDDAADAAADLEAFAARQQQHMVEPEMEPEVTASDPAVALDALD